MNGAAAGVAKPGLGIMLALPHQDSLFSDVRKKKRQRKAPEVLATQTKQLLTIHSSSKSLIESQNGKALLDTLGERLGHYAHEVLLPSVKRLAFDTPIIETAPDLFHAREKEQGEGAFVTRKDLPNRKVPAAKELVELMGDGSDITLVSQHILGIRQRAGMIVAQSKREKWNNSQAGDIRKCVAKVDYLVQMHELAGLGRLDGLVVYYEDILPRVAKRTTAARELLHDDQVKEAVRIAKNIIREQRASIPAPVKKQKYGEQLEFSIIAPQVETEIHESPSMIAINSAIAGSVAVMQKQWVAEVENAMRDYQNEGLLLHESGIVAVLATAAVYLREGDFVGFHNFYFETVRMGEPLAGLAQKELGAKNAIVEGQIERTLNMLHSP
jgi:hypothetical protein